MATGTATIKDTNNTTIESRITRKGEEGTGESGTSIKDSAGNTIVTAAKKGSSTTVQPTSTVYDSAGRLTTAAISGDPNIKGDYVYIYKGNSKLLKPYYNSEAQAYIKSVYDNRQAAAAKAAEAARVAEAARIAEAQRMAQAAIAMEAARKAALATPTPTVAKSVPVTTTKAPTISVSDAFAKMYSTPTVAVPVTQAPSVVSVTKEQSTSLLKNPAVMEINKSNTGLGTQGQTSMTMAEIKKAEKIEEKRTDPTNLGILEKYVAPVEKKITDAANKAYVTVEKSRTVKAIDTVNPLPVATSLKLGIAAVEGAVTLPTSTIRLVKGVTTDPVRTAGGVIDSTMNMAISDPIRLTGNLAGGAIAAGGIVKGIKIVESKVPSISNAPQEVYLKTKVATSGEPTVEIPKGVTQAEYLGKNMGTDIFEIKELKTEAVATVDKTPVITEKVLIGKTEAGYTEVYKKITPEQANAISKKMSANVENVNINKGTHAVVIEPTGELPAQVKYTTTENLRIAKVQEPTLIGKETVKKTSQPMRLETKLTLEEAELTIKNVPERLQLPENTFDMEVKPTKAMQGDRQIASEGTKSRDVIGKDMQLKAGQPIDYTPAEFKYRRGSPTETFSPDYTRSEFNTQPKPVAQEPQVIQEPTVTVKQARVRTVETFKYDLDTNIGVFEDIPTQAGKLPSRSRMNEPLARLERDISVGRSRPVKTAVKERGMTQAEFNRLFDSDVGKMMERTEASIEKTAKRTKSGAKDSSLEPRVSRSRVMGITGTVGKMSSVPKLIPKIDSREEYRGPGDEYKEPGNKYTRQPTFRPANTEDSEKFRSLSTVPIIRTGTGRKTGTSPISIPETGTGTGTKPGTLPKEDTVPKPITAPITAPVTSPVTSPVPKPIPKPVTSPYPTKPSPTPDIGTGGGGKSRPPRLPNFRTPPIPVPSIKKNKRKATGTKKRGTMTPGEKKNKYTNPMEIDMSKAERVPRARIKKYGIGR